MLLSLTCECGETYHADKNHIGLAIGCTKCGRIIHVSDTPKQEKFFESVTENKPSSNRTVIYGVVATLVLGTISIAIFSCGTTNSPNRTTDNKNTGSPVANIKQPQNNKINQNVAPPSTTPLPVTTRYPNGKDLSKPQNLGGAGKLEITNGTSSDAIAKLIDVKTNKTIRLVYIQANNVFTIKNIKIGEYILKFSLGNDFIPETNKFLRNQSYSKFDDTFDFQDSDFTVTLNPVEGGTAKTSSLNEEDFEDK